jgi:hypothetical protein
MRFVLLLDSPILDIHIPISVANKLVVHGSTTIIALSEFGSSSKLCSLTYPLFYNAKRSMQLELLNSKWTMTKKQTNIEATMCIHILFTVATIFFWHKPLELRFTLLKREKREYGFKTNRSSQIQHGFYYKFN